MFLRETTIKVGSVSATRARCSLSPPLVPPFPFLATFLLIALYMPKVMSLICGGLQEDADDIFAEINYAYAVLSDVDERGKYDYLWKYEQVNNRLRDLTGRRRRKQT